MRTAPFCELLRRDPDSRSSLLNLARLELSLGRTAEAREALTSWLARHPGDAAAQELLEQIQKK